MLIFLLMSVISLDFSCSGTRTHLIDSRSCICNWYDMFRQCCVKNLNLT